MKKKESPAFSNLPILVVDKVTKARSINDVELKTDAILLNIGAQDLDANSLWAFLRERGMFLGRVQGSVEQRVDESRFSKARFT